MITGYLITGFLAGPDILGVLVRPMVDQLGFVNQIALAIIALAAGNELVLKEFRSQFRSIGWVTFGLVVTTFGLGAVTMYILSGWLPVMKDLGTSTRIAIALLAGVILVARSPSSAIAIVNELRAKGALTNTILGVTVIMDAVVIALFAVNSEIAHSITSSDFHFGFSFLGLLLVKFALSIGAGCALWKLLCGYLRWPVPHYLKFVLLLVTGFGVFQLTDWFHHFSEDTWGLKIHAEPLLICMIAGILAGAGLIGLALFLTLFIMWPTVSDVYEDAFRPFSDGEIGIEEIDFFEENVVANPRFLGAPVMDVSSIKMERYDRVFIAYVGSTKPLMRVLEKHGLEQDQIVTFFSKIPSKSRTS